MDVPLLVERLQNQPMPREVQELMEACHEQIAKIGLPIFAVGCGLALLTATCLASKVISLAKYSLEAARITLIFLSIAGIIMCVLHQNKANNFF